LLGNLRDNVMDKKYVLQILANSKQELVHRYGITHLALFGSTARDEVRPMSRVARLV